MDARSMEDRRSTDDRFSFLLSLLLLLLLLLPPNILLKNDLLGCAC